MSNRGTFRFEDVMAWQKAYQFTLSVYKATKEFPESERFGLTSQFQRAAISIPANIAEGYKRIGKPDKLRFLNIAQGSLEECRCYINLAKDLEYTNISLAQELYEKLEEASKFLNLYCKGIINNNFTDGL
ncbi:MAG: four helix bundle protein [Prevotella sp.]|nr:four helix bundle protein [Prevotella sp.]